MERGHLRSPSAPAPSTARLPGAGVRDVFQEALDLVGRKGSRLDRERGCAKRALHRRGWPNGGPSTADERADTSAAQRVTHHLPDLVARILRDRQLLPY